MVASSLARLTAVVLLGWLVACASPPIEVQLRTAIADFHASKPDVTQEQIDALFAQLDAEIATLKAKVAQRHPSDRASENKEVQRLQDVRDELAQAYAAAHVARLGRAASDAVRGVGDAIGKGLEEAGRGLRDKMQDRSGQ